MSPSVVDMSYPHGGVHQSSSFHHSTLPSTSTASSNLSGYFCSTGPFHENFSTKDYCSCGFAQGSHQGPIDFLPSPPPTNSDPKRSVPLPSLGSNAEAGPSSPISPRCRDSTEPSITSAMERVPLLSFPAPMTPPPTISTSTLDLPPAEADMDIDTEPKLSSIPTSYDNLDASLLGLPSESSCPNRDNSVDHLFSPISLEWTTSGIGDDMTPSPPSSSGTTSVLLGGDHSHLFLDAESIPYSPESDDNNTLPHCRPILPHLDIPFQFSSPQSMWSESPTSSVDFDDELDMLATPNTLDMDIDTPSTPRSLPTTPFAHNLTFTSDDKLFNNDFGGEDYGYYLEPPLHELAFLPELDDIPDSHSSPSLRSFSMLPSLEVEEEDEDPNGLTSPPSPGATLICLPGADPDDFPFPPDLNPYPPSVDSASSLGSRSGSLLLLEDERLPRSPSPENYDVDLASIEDSTDPNIRRLGELRRRSFNAERAARQLEQALLQRGAVHQRWEARRARKKEKERGREIGAMLRLKMAQAEEKGKYRAESVEVEGERKEEISVKKKDAISTMEQLVAKMLLRRNDTYRSLANRKTPLTSKFYASSPLVQYSDFVDMDMHLDDEYAHESSSPLWTGDSKCESGPRTLSAWTTSLSQSSSSSC